MTLLHPTSRSLLTTASFAVLFMLGTAVFSVAHAQITGIDQLTQAGIVSNPRYPAPGETVSLRAKSSKIEMSSAMVTWYINGEMVQQSRGGVRYTYTAGPAGSVAKIEVTITSPDSKTVRASLTQRVHEVVIVWEGDTYTPPLFAGRALHSPQSLVRVHAIPFVTRNDGTPYDIGELLFSWASRGSSAPFEAGVGLDTISVQNPKPNETLKLSLFIKDLEGETLTIEHVDVPVAVPEVLFYTGDPLAGLRLERTLVQDFTITGAEHTVYAEPYYMIAQSRTDENLVYDWNVAGQKLNTPGSLVLRPEGSGAGVADIKLTVRNSEYWAQRFGGRLLLNFTATNSGSVSDTETTPL